MKFIKTAITLGLISLVPPSYSVSQQQSVAEQVEQQRTLHAHAKHFFHLDNGKPYYEQKPDSDGAIDLSAGMLNDYAAAPGGTLPPQDQLKQLTEAFPVVIAGIAKRQLSALLPKQSFVYSDWTFEVTDVLKSISTIGISQAQQLTVTRSGGSLLVNNVRIVAHDKNFPDFQIGHRYLLFLTPLPDSDSFLASANGTFDVTGPKVVYLDDPQRETDLRSYSESMTPSSLIAEVKSIAGAIRNR